MTEADRHGEGFSEFVAGVLPGLLRFGYMLTGTPEEAEDLAHEALAKCLRCWVASQPLCALAPHGAWLRCGLS